MNILSEMSLRGSMSRASIGCLTFNSPCLVVFRCFGTAFVRNLFCIVVSGLFVFRPEFLLADSYDDLDLAPVSEEADLAYVSAEGAIPNQAGFDFDVEFEGNVVLLDTVYAAVLRYAGRDTFPKERDAQAQWIKLTLERFLRSAGYALASVAVRSKPDGFAVRIDEGRLDKIIFLRADPWVTVQLIFMLGLPNKVYNELLVTRGLQRVRDGLGFKDIEYELVRVDHSGQRFTVDDPKIIDGFTLIHPGQSHELRVKLKPLDRVLGLDLAIDVQPPDGLFVSARYFLRSVFFDNDRLETWGRFGIRLTEVSDIPGNRVALSQAGTGSKWSTPPIGDYFRLSLALDAALEARPREDLDLINYFFAPVRFGPGVVFEYGDIDTSLDIGLEQRYVFGIRVVDSNARTPFLDSTERDNLRFFVRLMGSWIFNPDRLRRDRPHEVSWDFRYLWPVHLSEGEIREAQLAYRNVYTFGFDEFHMRVSGVLRGGRVPFYGEVAMGDGFLRSAFQGNVYARNAVGTNNEYRLSLSADNFKVSLFNDFVVYESLDRSRKSNGGAVIDNFGFGVHFLIVDAFQLNAYVGLGIRSDGETNFGISVDVREAF